MNNDLISKFEAIDRIDTYFCVTCYVKKEGGACGGCMIKDVKEIIDDTNAVDAKPVRHGRWILKAHDKRVNYLWTVTAYCSECCDEENEIWSGHFPGVPDMMAQDIALDSAKSVKLSNYCPNCGAKMDAEEEG